MSQPVAPRPDSPAAAPDQKRPPSNRHAWWVIAGAVLIVLAPLVAFGLPVEIANWYLAHSAIEQEAGNYEAALAAIEKAIEYAPQEPSVYLRRCQVYRELDDLEASLADANRALKLAPTSREAHREVAATLMEMERFAEAVEAFEVTAERVPAGVDARMRAGPLNSLAYARALAGENLDQALAEVNQALDYIDDDAAMLVPAMLDTRGFIYYRQGKLPEALADLERAVALSDLRRFEHWLERRRMTSSFRQTEETLEFQKHALAVMLYHRGLVYQAMNQPRLAEQDFNQVRELGHEPNESLF